MPLYNHRGELEFFSVEEVKRFLLNYDNFIISGDAFRGNPERYATHYLDSIVKMRDTPIEFREKFLSGLSLRNSDLNPEVEKCKQHLAK